MNDRRPLPTVKNRDVFESISLLSLLDVVRRNKLIIALAVILCTAGATVRAYTQPTTYEARVLMLLDLPPSSGLFFNPAETVSGQLLAIQETLRRRSILEPVIVEFDLYPHENGRVAASYLNGMAGRVQVLVMGTHTFNIVFRDGDPQRAAQVVTRVVEKFLEQSKATQESRAAGRVELIQAELADVETELLAKQEEIADFQRRSPGQFSADLQGYVSSMNRATTQLPQTNMRITDLEARRVTVMTEMQQLEALGYYVGDSPDATNGDSPPPAAPSREVLDARTRLLTLRERYTDDHPAVAQAERELQLAIDRQNASGTSAVAGGPNLNGQQLRYIRLKADLEGIDQQLAFFEEEKRQLMSEMVDYQERSAVTTERDKLLQDMVRDHDITRRRWESLMNMLDSARQTARLQPGGGPLAFQVLEAARVPLEPVNPLRERTILLGLLAGLGLAGAIVLVRQQLDTSFSDVEDLQGVTNAPTLAAIPSIPTKGFGRKRKTPVPSLNDHTSIASEQYRILASRLRHMIDQEYSHVVLLTSAAGNEGKTTTAINLALALAEIQEERVLLIDADLRRPRVREYLPEAPDDGLGAQEGLRDLLKNPEALGPEFFGRVGKLYVLAGRHGTDDSLEELISESARQTFARLRKRFKYILIDSPPVLPMVDSHVLAELSDRVVFIVRARQTRRETLTRALESFDPKDILGLVLNDVAYNTARYAPAYRHYAKEYQPKRKVQARVRVR